MSQPRPGEEYLAQDPADAEPDAQLVFIGRLETPWKTRDECPRNLRQARERGLPGRLLVDEPYRRGLHRLERYSHIFLLTWFDRSSRNLIVQNPRHAEEPSGTFALRSPVRPNPIGLHLVEVTDFDAENGVIGLAAIDTLDGTPVIDIKPYLPTIDSPDGQKG